MKTVRKLNLILLILLIPLLLSSCFAVRVQRDVNNPDKYFRQAYERLVRIHTFDPEREGKTHQIKVLIFDRSDRQLVRITAPFWLVNKIMDFGAKASHEEEGFDFEDRYDFGWRNIKDLQDVGPGLLIEVDDEENRILVWIE